MRILSSRAGGARHAGAVAIMLILASACGHSTAERAQQTLATAMAATNAARDSFLAWDGAHQQQLVVEAPNRGEAELKLTAYRARRQTVVAAFTTAYAALAAAATAVPLLEAGKANEAELVARIVEAVQAVDMIKRALAALEGP
jgi:hypothetical protein